jgi:hypothetical protein
MRVLLASSELEPYSKTGGLADMTAALGKYLARAGHQVGIVTPLHRCVLAGVRRKVAGAMGAQDAYRRIRTDPERWEMLLIGSPAPDPPVRLGHASAWAPPSGGPVRIASRTESHHLLR